MDWEKDRREMVNCTSCGEVLEGVYSHHIRRVCDYCLSCEYPSDKRSIYNVGWIIYFD